MSNDASKPASLALLLGLLVPGAVALAVRGGTARGPGVGVSVSHEGSRVEGTTVPVGALGGRVPAPRRQAPVGVRERRPDAARPVPASRGARNEREFLAGFLALEGARPGTLAERAEALITGDGPAPEKVALLRALGESGAGEAHLRWLERAARELPDESGPHGGSVARFALGELVAASRAQPDARQALRRLAFRTPDLDDGLRRIAALGLARSADEAEVRELLASLARESDALLVAGVRAALEIR